jgi:mono/diheme cytochrome c family protein
MSPIRALSMLSAAALLVLIACSESDSRAQGKPDGKQLFAQQACVTCHGENGQGSMLGPALTAVKSNWTREALVAYLDDPQAYTAKDPRLAKQGKAYFQPMPSYKALKPEERGSLADFVLGLH